MYVKNYFNYKILDFRPTTFLVYFTIFLPKTLSSFILFSKLIDLCFCVNLSIANLLKKIESFKVIFPFANQ